MVNSLNNFHLGSLTAGCLCVMSHCDIDSASPVRPGQSDNRRSYSISDFLFQECHKENKYHHCLVKMVSTTTINHRISWNFQKLSPPSSFLVFLIVSVSSSFRFKILQVLGGGFIDLCHLLIKIENVSLTTMNGKTYKSLIFSTTQYLQIPA